MSDEQDHTTDYHAPVMVQEVLEWLDVSSGTRLMDGTAGGGGHTEAMLEAAGPQGRVVALDRDPRAIREVRDRLGDDERLEVVEANYAEASRVLERLGWPKVDGWLIDAGVSSHQLEDPDRGFSFQREGPLDMRMGPRARRVADLLDETDVDELTRMFRDYGELSDARHLAEVIVEARREGRLETTSDLADLVEEHRGRPPWEQSSIHPATLVFQALRIAANRELAHLKEAVQAVPEVVADGGRAVFISFHSLEDRIVKHGFRRLADPCVCPPDLPRCGCEADSFGTVLTSGPVRPTEREVENNPRARSAKLRAFEVRSGGRWPRN